MVIKTSIEIDDLRKMEERRVELPPDIHYFSTTISYLINDFSDKNDMSVEDVLKNINDTVKVVQRFK